MMRIIEMEIYAWRQLCAWVLRTLHPSSGPGPIPPPDRADLFRQLTALRVLRAADTARHRQLCDALTRDLLPAEARVDTLRRALREAHADEFRRSLNGATSENAILCALEGKTPTSLALLLEELISEIERLQRTAPTTVIGMHREGRAVESQPSVQSDGPSLHRRLTALRHAQQRAEAMRFEPLTIEQLNSEILRLKRTLPKIEQEFFCNERVAILTAY